MTKKTIMAMFIIAFGMASLFVMANPALGATIIANSWAPRASMNEARTGAGVAAVNGKIYAIGGANQNGFRATNEEYSPATNTWTLKEPMPTPRSAFGIAVYQNKIYCIGGYIPGGATRANEVYDPATDTWETKTPMPTAELNLQANAVNGKIYLIGGSQNGSIVQVYDPDRETWSTQEPVPTAVSSYLSAVVDNKIFVITTNLNQIYDTENNSWRLGNPPPLPAILGSAVATTGAKAPTRIYVFGADADLPFWQLTTRKFTTQSYDPKNDSWSPCASSSTGRFDASAAIVDDLTYLIGGFTMKFPTDRLTLNAEYIYSPANEQYTPVGYGLVSPVITVNSPRAGNYSTSAVSLNFTLNRAVDWIGYSLDGQDNITVSGNITLTGLPSGTHNVTVYARDESGNEGASETITFYVAEPFPTVSVITVFPAVIAAAGLLFYFKKRRRQTAMP